MKLKKRRGLLILEQVEFDDYVKRKVHKSNKSSGKITVPISWIGKNVIVVLENVEK
jgi:putative transposon-encoded protein